jgi:hypothetical protein
MLKGKRKKENGKKEPAVRSRHQQGQGNQKKSQHNFRPRLVLGAGVAAVHQDRQECDAAADQGNDRKNLGGGIRTLERVRPMASRCRKEHCQPKEESSNKAHVAVHPHSMPSKVFAQTYAMKRQQDKESGLASHGLS